MKKTLSRIMLAAAASSLAITPVVAQAGTRASQSAATYSVSGPGKGRDAKGESLTPAFTIFLGILALGTIAATVAAVASGSSDDSGRSPGT